MYAIMNGILELTTFSVVYCTTVWSAASMLCSKKTKGYGADKWKDPCVGKVSIPKRFQTFNFYCKKFTLKPTVSKLAKFFILLISVDTDAHCIAGIPASHS